MNSFQQMQRGELDADRHASTNGGGGLDRLSGQLVSDTAPGFRSPALTVAEQLQALTLQDDIAGMPLGQVVGLIRLAVAAQHVNATEPEIRAEAERRFGAAREVAEADATPVEPRAEDRGVLTEQEYENRIEDERRQDHFRAAQAGVNEHGIGPDTDGGPNPDYDPSTDPLATMAEKIQALNVEAQCTAEMSLHMITNQVRQATSWAKGGLRPTEEEIVHEAERIWGAFSDQRKGPRVATVGPDGIVEAVRPAEMTPDRGDVTHHHQVSEDDGRRFSGGGANDDSQRISRLIPQDVAFQKRQYIEAPALANLADTLIERHGFLEQLEACKIDFKWQRVGANSKGKRSIGKLKRVSGEFVDYCPAQFIISLAADTARLASFTDLQVEAALFHQLLHIDRDKKGNWIKVGHDFEGFGTEVRHYGPWTEDLKIGGQAFTAAHQMGLFDRAGAEGCDDDEDEEDDDEVVDLVGLSPEQIASVADETPPGISGADEGEDDLEDGDILADDPI